MKVKDFLPDAYVLYHVETEYQTNPKAFQILDINKTFLKIFKMNENYSNLINPLTNMPILYELFCSIEYEVMNHPSNGSFEVNKYIHELNKFFFITILVYDNNCYILVLHEQKTVTSFFTQQDKLNTQDSALKHAILPDFYNKNKHSFHRELVRIKESLSRAQQVAHVGNWEFDILNNKEYWSEELFRIYGFEPNEFLTFPGAFQMRVFPEDKHIVEDAIKGVWIGKAYNIEVRIIKKNYQLCWIHDQAKITYNSLGKPIRIYGTVQDITERKLIELKLKENEEKYRKLIEHLVPGLCYYQVIFDNNNKPVDYQIIDVNTSYEQLTGFNKSDLVGKYATQINPNVLTEGYFFLETLGNVSTTGCSKTMECLRHNRWFNIIFYSPEPCYVAAIFSDITSRKQLENELITAKEAAEEASLSKSEFLATISHELRTPLNVILSAIQLFTFKIEKDGILTHEKASGHLKAMNQNCLRLIRLVNNILDSNRIDAGYFDLKLQNHDVINIIRNITESLDDYLTQKNIRLKFSTTMKTRNISCDLYIIERIMLNLLSNAIKFTNEGGNIQVKISSQKDFIVISVKDDGVGIPFSMQSLVFERYKQADALLTREHEGSGIGLSITKTLVELHGGTIELKSKEGHGCEFRIRLPDKMIEEPQLATPKDILNNNLVERINVEFSDIYYVS